MERGESNLKEVDTIKIFFIYEYFISFFDKNDSSNRILHFGPQDPLRNFSGTCRTQPRISDTYENANFLF